MSSANSRAFLKLNINCGRGSLLREGTTLNFPHTKSEPALLTTRNLTRIMKLKKRKELLAKGWQEEEVKKAENILERAEKHDVFFSKMVFWSAMVVIIFANLLVSLILVPFLVTLNHLFLYAIIVVIAATVGFLYNFLITDIGHLEKKHHVWAGILVPILALANMIVMVVVSNRLIDSLSIELEHHNPLLTSVTFAVAFILPYIIDRIMIKVSEGRRRRKAVLVQ